MDPSPLVSVVTIFLNTDRVIEEAVRSFFAQAYRHRELLAVNDRATDLSNDLARDYAVRHPEKVRYLEHPQAHPDAIPPPSRLHGSTGGAESCPGAASEGSPVSVGRS
jgi:hypothetical protein